MKFLSLFHDSYMELRNESAIVWCFLIGCLAFLLQSAWIIYFEFSTRFLRSAIYDGLLFVIISLLILSFQRKIHYGALNLSALVFVVYTAAFLKFDAFGEVLRYSDTFLLPTLIEFLGYYQSLFLIIPAAAIPVIFVVNFRVRIFCLVPLGIAVTALCLYGFQKSLSVDKFDARTNSHMFARAITHGQIPGFVDDSYEYIFRSKELRRYGNLLGQVKDGRFLIDQDFAVTPDRDVHIVLVESLINPDLLDGYSFSPLPFGDLFTKWIELSPNVLAPVTGGRSPDSEFELLCGLGALLNWRETAFTALTADTARCLPWHLSKNGWTTVATTPVSPHAFNVKSVYERISFSKIILQPDLKMNDLDGRNLSTESLLRQNLDMYRQFKKNGSFVFNYVFTTATHFPFNLNTRKRPLIVESFPEDPVITQYVNTLHHTFQALEFFVSDALREDPKALIVILGDHAPYLGPGFSFRDEIETSGLANFRIPLLILDKGLPVADLGNIALFDLPYLLLDILSDHEYCRSNRCRFKEELLIRPLVGEAYVAQRDLSDITHCQQDNHSQSECVLARDLTSEHRSRLYELVR